MVEIDPTVTIREISIAETQINNAIRHLQENLKNYIVEIEVETIHTVGQQKGMPQISVRISKMIYP